MLKVGFLGGGKMAQALANGMIASGIFSINHDYNLECDYHLIRFIG